MRGEIDEFFEQKKPEDLLVLYFSGHGIRDELGALYLAVKNTIHTRLRSTAIKSDYIRESMDQSRSKRQVLILDCCNSGAFEQGTKAATGVSIGTASAFEAGYGRIILTASDSTQFAWEGNRIIGETSNSLFTHFLVKGLKGDADLNSDGCITVDELYDYAYEKVKLSTPKQTPSKFSSKQQGEIVLRQNIQIEGTRLTSLPDDLIVAMNSSLPYIREGAVRQLEVLLNGRNLGLARSARSALEKIAAEDDSRRVSQAATQALATIHRVEKEANEEQWVVEEAEEQRLALEKAAEKRLLQEMSEAQFRLTKPASFPEKVETIKPIASWFALLWITLGWATSPVIIWTTVGTILELLGENTMRFIIIRVTTGAFGGLITSIVLRTGHVLSRSKSMLWITLAWSIDWGIVETVGLSMGWSLPIRGAIFGAIGGLITSMTLRSEHVLSHWKRMLWITLGWTIAGSIAGPVFGALFGAIGGAIGGFTMIWQIRQSQTASGRR